MYVHVDVYIFVLVYSYNHEQCSEVLHDTQYSTVQCLQCLQCIKSIKVNYSVLYLQCIAVNMIMKCGRGLHESVCKAQL